MQKRKKIGEILLEKGFIGREDLKKALALQKNNSPHQPLGLILEEMGAINERQLAQGLGDQFNLPFVDLSRELPDPEVAKKLPEATARQCRALPLQHFQNRYLVAVEDPRNIALLDVLPGILGGEVEIAVAPAGQLKRLTNQLFSGSDDPTAVELADQILEEALLRDASDIHLEPSAEKVMVRYRVDGVLETGFSVPKAKHLSLISRFKIIAGMDIGEKRRPQDGRLKLKKDKNYDLRLATLPGYHGERLAIRILDRFSIPTLDKLGLNQHQQKKVEQTLGFRDGIFLVTGPTGSGKTTTLFSMLRVLQQENLNITTVEDPIEYILPGVSQVQVNHRIGLDFAYLLRSILRHDPDVIMVGEIRDRETAEIAVNAALTGHLVLSTLHTNDAPSAIIRLLDMGIEPYLLASTIIGIMGQRLLRRLCPDCSTREELPVWATDALEEQPLVHAKVKEARGCQGCFGTGYRGRTALAEILFPDDKLREQIVRKHSAGKLKSTAALSMEGDLKEEGWKKVERGETSLKEVLRVVPS